MDWGQARLQRPPRRAIHSRLDAVATNISHYDAYVVNGKTLRLKGLLIEIWFLRISEKGGLLSYT